MSYYFGNSLRLVVAEKGYPVSCYTYTNLARSEYVPLVDAYTDLLRRMEREVSVPPERRPQICAAVILEFDGPFTPSSFSGIADDPTYARYEDLHKRWARELKLWSDCGSPLTETPEYPLLDVSRNPGCYGAKVIAEFYGGVSEGTWPEVLLKQLERRRVEEDPDAPHAPTPALPQPAGHNQLDLF